MGCVKRIVRKQDGENLPLQEVSVFPGGELRRARVERNPLAAGCHLKVHVRLRHRLMYAEMELFIKTGRGAGGREGHISP